MRLGAFFTDFLEQSHERTKGPCGFVVMNPVFTRSWIQSGFKPVPVTYQIDTDMLKFYDQALVDSAIAAAS